MFPADKHSNGVQHCSNDRFVETYGAGRAFSLHVCCGTQAGSPDVTTSAFTAK